MRRKALIWLVGGGSGGHIIPHLAVAEVLKITHPTLAFLYVGSRRPLDRTPVEATGIPFVPIFAGKLRRYFSWRNFIDPLLFIVGFFQSLVLIFRFWPRVIFLTGGYTSFPVVLAGALLRRPMILLESDSAMGLANRVSAFFVRRVLLAYPDAYVGPKALCIGNPVRTSVTRGNPEQGWKFTGLRPGKPVLLVMGGSLGAQRLNELVIEAFPLLQKDCQVIHITGVHKETSFRAPGYASFSYLDHELPDVYSITDLILSRAGANALAEIALLKKPNILIPLPDSAQDNQQKNALYFEQHGASLVLPQQDLTSRKLVDTVLALLHNASLQSSLRAGLASLARPEAAGRIGEIIMEYSG